MSSLFRAITPNLASFLLRSYQVQFVPSRVRLATGAAAVKSISASFCSVYFGQSGSPATFESPVLANCTRYVWTFQAAFSSASVNLSSYLARSVSIQMGASNGSTVPTCPFFPKRQTALALGLVTPEIYFALL